MLHFRNKLAGSLFIFLTISLTSAHALAQEEWKHIRTPHYDVLFLEEMSREAQRLANMLETLHFPIANSLKVPPGRIPILLRNKSAISNGFAALDSPRRAVFYSFPPSNSKEFLNNEWLQTLAIHELRHVAQHEYQLNPYVLIDASFILPDLAWLQEGDAVGIETALSTGGRGRSPYFSLLYKVNLLEQGGFSYYKQMIRSFRDQVPDHYRLGYIMTTYLRRKYGSDIIHQLFLREGIWEHVNPFTLYRRVKKLTGKTITQIYKEANEELKKLWEQQLQGLTITPKQFIEKRISTDYTDYTYPQPTQGGIITLKSGIGTPAQFIKIDPQGHEETICTPADISLDEKFSIAQDLLVWIRNNHEQARFGEHTNVKAIQSYNLKTKQYSTIGAAGRYHAASLSPDGTRLAVCLTDKGYNHHIQILHTDTGECLQEFPNPENRYYLTPSWSLDSKQLIVTTHAHNKATITCINLETGGMQDILPYTTEAIDHPILHGEYVYYGSPYSGIDNIYVVQLSTKQRFQVTSSKYGAYHPTISADGKWLLYNDFGKDGMDAVQSPLHPKHWTPIAKVQDRSMRYYQPLVTQEDMAGVLNKVPKVVYPIEKSGDWERAYIRPRLKLNKLLKGTVGGEVAVKNTWKTLEWTLLGYQYSPFQSMHEFYTQLTYKGWWPTFSAGFGWLKGKMDEQNCLQANWGVKVPWVWYGGMYTHQLVLSTNGQLNTPPTFKKWHLTQDYTLLWKRKSPQSKRDIRAPWGQTLQVSYTHALNLPFFQQYAARGSWYFPGLFAHHSLRAGIGYHYKNASIPFWDEPVLKLHSLYDKDHQVRFRMDYAFPLAYPDWEPAPYTLLKRIGANLIYDCSYDIKNQKTYHAVGIGLDTDISWLHLGVRCMYSITKGEPSFSFR